MLTDKNNEVMAKILEALNNNKKSEDLINHINARINDIKDEELKLKESMKILEELKQS
jgi:DNA-binding transcriptional regulator GbsR (MarR family)|tara:strand:+ start:991 stop:1164 length:174 start_codon:yes stop_codon:yes gene_type:complete